ncbi:aromatic ring-hydroxylating dioxygenase subunit alpha [Hoeflea sp. TYP-13]|uniref:aromatic ring-hydroxylating dioxygenase subunit alpha n=1 Tax=Hoeflea sp. TYP-13 TaxID=3230023 RepID=UPI0034C5EC57
MAMDPFTWSHWYAIGRLEDVPEGGTRKTRLLGIDIVAHRSSGEVTVERVEDHAPLAVQERYGHVWTTFSDEPKPLYDMPEFDEDGRRLVTAGCVTVRCSGLRAVENFLDMAHFPFVHTGILGEEDHAEVEQYCVEMRADVNEVWATKCRFYQPKAAATAEGGQMTHYKYRVPHPFSTILYKTCPIREGAWDLVGLFIQPRDEDLCDVHSFVLVFDEENTDTGLLHFQQTIFLQDRMILENQVPALLPLDPRRELPTRADASSIAYRRWLKENGQSFGVLAEEAVG